jgi:Uma2 family endonuclease
MGAMAIVEQARAPYPLSRAEYVALHERGAFDDDDTRVELLYGRIVPMSPIGGPHRYSVRRLSELLIRGISEGRAVVYVQSSFLAPFQSQPEPDITVVAPGDYLDDPPAVAYLVIEVAETSLRKDRDLKARLYAAAGVPEYWIVNVVNDVVEVHTEPGPDGYAQVTRYGRGSTLRVPSFEDVVLRVDDVLPPRR